MVRSIVAVATGITLLLAQQVSAQNKSAALSPEQKQAAYDAIRQLSPEQRHAAFLKDHKRKPELKAATPAKTGSSAEPASRLMKTTAPYTTVPGDARFPGEYEEVQAVFISWMYDYSVSSPVIDTMLSSPYAALDAQLANGIQQAGVPVYINVWTAADSAAVRQFMIKRGTPLKNYRFFINDGDNIWARDFGPVNYYYGTDDSLGWVDFHYYPGWDLDDLLPIAWGKELNIPVTTSGIYYEGGNILADGAQSLYTSSAVYDLNSSILSYTPARTVDSIKDALNLDRATILSMLNYDGGTGHIDLYLDMTDENTFVQTLMPAAAASIPRFRDYDTVNSNIKYLRTLNSSHAKPHHFYHIPFPTKDDGSMYTSAEEYNNEYTRTYSNHLIVNKTIIQPVFNDGISGNIAGDNAAIDSIKKVYPGYKIIPIDMRWLDGSGGSIHCITKEMAADNPLRFFHYAYRDREDYQSNYPIDAVITNRSGIASATLFWRLKGASAWTAVSMIAASGNHWTALIPASSGTTVETFEYYISATSVNGKTITRPMPGVDGPYVFWYDKLTSVDAATRTVFEIGNLYPNPATDFVNMELVPANPAQVQAIITDMTGKTVTTQDFGQISSRRYLRLNTSNMPAGIYTIQLYGDGVLQGTRKLIRK